MVKEMKVFGGILDYENKIPFLNIKSRVVETCMSHFIIMKHLIDVKQLYLELMNSNVKMFLCA
jgi:hypothetical protein